MRTLVVGMQNSGASWITFCLTQQAPPMVSVIDIHGGRNIDQSFSAFSDCIVKYTINRTVTFLAVAARLRPDRVVFVRRNPDDIACHLVTKCYRNFHGTMKGKLRMYRELCRRADTFDEVIDYEAFAGVPIVRTVADVLWFNCENSIWCRRFYRQRWGFGGLRDVPVTAADLQKRPGGGAE